MMSWENWENLVHYTTYSYTKGMVYLGIWHDWDKVAPGLFLSKVPVKGEASSIKEYIEKNQDGPLTLVVRVVEPKEVNTDILNMRPIRKEEWVKEHKVDVITVEMKDFTKVVDLNEAINAILMIQERRERKESAVVHCKAGRSRSAMLVTCVMAVYDMGKCEENKNKTSKELVDLAIEEIQKFRPQIKLEDKYDKAIEIVAAMKKMLDSKPDKSEATTMKFFFEEKSHEQKDQKEVEKEDSHAPSMDGSMSPL